MVWCGLAGAILSPGLAIRIQLDHKQDHEPDWGGGERESQQRTCIVTAVAWPLTSKTTAPTELPKLRPVRVTVPPVEGRLAGVADVITGAPYPSTSAD